MAIACVGPTVDLSGQGGRWPQAVLNALEPKPRFPRLAAWEDAAAPAEPVYLTGGGAFVFEGEGTVAVSDAPPRVVSGAASFLFEGSGTIRASIGVAGDMRTAFRWSE
jgi:hypothetical protein